MSSLRQLHTLNRQFIALLLVRDDNAVVASGLSPAFIAQLRTLDAVAMHELCATPYTLYHLPFGNPTYWHEMARVSAEGEPIDRSFRSREGDAQHLTEMALFLAWHVACTDAASARLFFGMADGTVEFFRGTDVATLSGVALHAAQLLQPRWPTNPHFWSDLIRSAGTDRVRLQAARLLGAQLLTSELYGEHVVQRLPRRLRLSMSSRPSTDSAPLTAPAGEQLAVVAPL